MSNWREVATLNSVDFRAPTVSLTDGMGTRAINTALPFMSVGMPGAQVVNMRNEHDDKSMFTVQTKYMNIRDEGNELLMEGASCFVSNPAIKSTVFAQGECFTLGQLNQQLMSKEFNDQADLDKIIQSFLFAGIISTKVVGAKNSLGSRPFVSLISQGLTEKVHDYWGMATKKGQWLWFTAKPIKKADKDKAFEKPDPQKAPYTASRHAGAPEKKSRGAVSFIDEDSDDGQSESDEDGKYHHPSTRALHVPAAGGGSHVLVVRPFYTDKGEYPPLAAYSEGDLIGTCIFVGHWFDDKQGTVNQVNPVLLSTPDNKTLDAVAAADSLLLKSNRRLFIKSAPGHFLL